MRRFALTTTLLALTALAACSYVRHERAERTAAHKVFTIEGLYGPESAKYDAAQDAWFISNMVGEGSAKDGQGYILKVSASNRHDAEVLVNGGERGATLNAPKGMAIHGDTLWVADIDVLRAFSRLDGTPLDTIGLAMHGAVLLNDVLVLPDGSLRVTDTGIMMTDKGVLHPGGDKIFAIGPNRAITVVAEGDSLRRPNGLAWDDHTKRWVVVAFDPFNSEVYSLSGMDSTRRIIAHGKGKFDGVEPTADGGLLVTSWSDSSVHLFDKGTDRQIIRNLYFPADLGADTRRNQLAIPLPMHGRVEIWQLPEAIQVAGSPAER
ncbi:MAG TPA: SMP-30/gluconolactonase/LRE family protein [Gemmatimonadaceae bacterium]|nr:SMP-30/gluconolactonase/LRE family protein [Gemmatimonadaceae bacterium]